MSASYDPPGPRATPAILASYVLVGACVLAVGADLRRIQVARDLGRGRVAVDALLSADQLVGFATAVLAVAARWGRVVRANRAALGPPSRSSGLVRAWAVAVLVAVVALLVAGTLLGDAADVADRERIDALRAVATAFAAVVVGLTIAVVSTLTAAQDDAARRVGAPRRQEHRADRAGVAEQSGLRVLSEADARGDRGAE